MDAHPSRRPRHPMGRGGYEPLTAERSDMLGKGESYAAVTGGFRWQVPELYNIGVDVCDRHADDEDRLALVFQAESGGPAHYTFAQLKRLSNQLANALAALGVSRGDRVGILLPQCPEAAITHVATYKLGGIAVPLFTLFGPDALEYRLDNSGVKAVVTDGGNLPKLLEIWARLPALEAVLVTDGETPDRVYRFEELLGKGSEAFEPVATRADDPALIIYTSGTTGPPKGALHAHRVLLGHLPGVEFPHNLFPEPGDFFWTPADWAWIGGLIDVLLPSWHHGVPVLAHRSRKFDPEEAFGLLAKYRVRNVFMPPTALKMMQQVPAPAERHAFRLRSVGSGGETLGEQTLAWGREALGLTVNEFYGQTEVNLIVGNCSRILEVRPGSMGVAVPGHTVEVVDDQGNPLPPGSRGQVAVRRPDPVMFLEYWGNPKATAEKFAGEWCMTGDMATRDEDGYFWYKGREDDLINSAGYRIGPSEIEESLARHPAVSRAAVIGSPDALRNEIVKAYVVLRPGRAPSPALAAEIQEHVKRHLAAHEYPRELEFLTELPMTATGKIKRDTLRELDREQKRRAGGG